MKIPQRPPAVDTSAFDDLADFVQALDRIDLVHDPYLPWEQMRWRRPPTGLSREQWWVATQTQRRASGRDLPFTDCSGERFFYVLPDAVLQQAERVAMRAGGRIALDDLVVNPSTRDRYLVSSLMEEAITSSQLEGATTTNRVAREMLRSRRRPRTKSEQMIWNNFQAMAFVRQHRDEAITPELVCELHRVVTEGTLEDPTSAGRLQAPQEERVVVETHDGIVLHAPPSADELPERLARLCAFASGREGTDQWLPASLRALTVHFMVGHDHYFVDGNGRLARALFYWVMLREGMWLAEFVAISSILRAAPVQYAHSYLYAEYDRDVTHFFLYHLNVLNRAFDALEKHLRQKAEESRQLRAAVRTSGEFNHRQLALLESALSRDVDYTVTSHGTSHRVSHETARQDLHDLEERGLLVRSRVGRRFVWRKPSDLAKRLGAGDS